MPDVLIIDDDPAFGTALRELLESMGLSADYLSDARSVVQTVRERRPRLVLLDVMMPGVDGFAACRAIRDDPEIGKVKIAIITGKEVPNDPLTSLEAGANVFFKKPVSLEKLRDEVRALLKVPGT